MHALLEICCDDHQRIVGLGVIESHETYYTLKMIDSKNVYKVRHEAIREIIRSKESMQIICSKTSISVFNVKVCGSACTNMLLCSKSKKADEGEPVFSGALLPPLLVLNSLWLEAMQTRADCASMALSSE